MAQEYKPDPDPATPTISESLEVLLGVMASVDDPQEDILKIIFADCDHGKVRDILYSFLDEPRQESRAERGDRLARDAAAWGPTALSKISQEAGRTEGSYVSPYRVGKEAAGMADGARGYFDPD